MWTTLTTVVLYPRAHTTLKRHAYKNSSIVATQKKSFTNNSRVKTTLLLDRPHIVKISGAFLAGYALEFMPCRTWDSTSRRYRLHLASYDRSSYDICTLLSLSFLAKEGDLRMRGTTNFNECSMGLISSLAGYFILHSLQLPIDSMDEIIASLFDQNSSPIRFC